MMKPRGIMEDLFPVAHLDQTANVARAGLFHTYDPNKESIVPV